ncbi:MAG TPA: BON domain-containing protein [Anaerolineales bacterium]|nr:BON domain-containing protein [Anaerolineales bacterium]
MNTKQNLILYSDARIPAEIWKAARQHDGIRALDIDSFSVSVQDSFVLLTGHLSRKSHRDLIEEIACSTPGVNAVHNNLVVDSDLTIQVAERLSMDERTRRFIFPVGSAHGWVRLGGVVPRRELQMAAEQIAAQVPFVRGVLSRPRVIGEYPETERRPIQPQIQAKVYDYNRQEGVVTQVVVQPRNRLVTHAVVSASGFHDGRFLFYEYLVPVEAMEVVNKESIFLKRKGPHLNAFPAFKKSDYPLAPSDWEPPYPYVAGAVRWTCEEREQAENKSNSSRLLRRQR